MIYKRFSAYYPVDNLYLSYYHWLSEANRVLEENGYKIVNIDSTVIAQKPKLRGYIDTMRRNIAGACKIDVSQVSVKATTEEKLGFTGRLEGISAHSVCLIE